MNFQMPQSEIDKRLLTTKMDPHVYGYAFILTITTLKMFLMVL